MRDQSSPEKTATTTLSITVTRDTSAPQLFFQPDDNPTPVVIQENALIDQSVSTAIAVDNNKKVNQGAPLRIFFDIGSYVISTKIPF